MVFKLSNQTTATGTMNNFKVASILLIIMVGVVSVNCEFNLMINDTVLYYVNGGVIVSSFTANIQTNLTITISHTIDLKVCIQRYAYTPDPLVYKNETCTYYFEIIANPKNQTELIVGGLQNIQYFIGIARVKETDLVGFWYANLTAPTCPMYSVWNNTDCVSPNGTLIANIAFPITLKKDEERLLNFTIDFGTNIVEYRITASSNNTEINELLFKVSHESSPYVNAVAQTGSNVIYSLPRKGIWYLLISSKGQDEIGINLTLFITPCLKDNKGGKSCNDTVLQSSAASLSQPLESDEILYFVYKTNKHNPLYAVVRSVDGSRNPRIMASFEQYPDPNVPESIDVSQCNQADCVATNRIITPIGTDGLNATHTWYIAVQSSTNKTTRFGIWFNSTCPPLCTIRGYCNETSPNTGICNCMAENYHGLDCSLVSDDFNFPFEILVGITGAIGGFILLGILAYCIMRRTKPEVEKVGYRPIS